MTDLPTSSVLRFAAGHPGIRAGARQIRPADETALLPDENAGLGNCVPEVRRASGAARLVARNLLRELDCTRVALPRRRHAPPAWPADVAGSLAHDATLAVAAVSRESGLLALGIDVEPAEPLEVDLIRLVTTPSERAALDASAALTPGGERVAALAARRLVVAKEAAYKAAYSLDRSFLDWQDIEIDDPAGTAEDGVALLSNGRRIPFSVGCVAGHFVAVARIEG